MEQFTAPRLDMRNLGCKAEMFFRANRINPRIACGKVFAFCMVALILGGVLSGTFYSLVTGGSILIGLLTGGFIAAQLACLISIFTGGVSELANHLRLRRLRFTFVRPAAAAFRSVNLRCQHRPPRYSLSH